MTEDERLPIDKGTGDTSQRTILSSWQVIWKGSTKLGIGYARTANRERVFVVGRYKGAGNVIGHYEENVLKADYLFKTFQDNCDGIF